MLRPHWIWPAAVDADTVRGLAEALRVPAPIAELLVRRGFATPDRAETFLDPALDLLHDPFQMTDMVRAVERIERALSQKEPIVVYGDYDVDGITATALLVRYLRWRGGAVEYYIPHRVEDGYGLSRAGLQGLRERGTGLVITCDCGVTAVEEVRGAQAAGMDVIVTDHHEPGLELPPAVAVLNPRRADGGYPDAHLAAVGVAFKLCEALELSAGRTRETLRHGLDLVALGTIADLVPVTGENRVLIRWGLDELSRTRNPGLRALLVRTGLAGQPLSAWQVGFVLAGEQWHPGVIGIVASRVVERFHRPTILIALDADGRGRGSARSVSGFHLLEALTACDSHLEAYGGHRHAAGLAIRQEAVEPFRAAFQQYARDRLRPEQLIPTLTIDLALPLEALDAPFLLALNRFSPYGPGNPEPVLALGGVAARGYPRIVGENHLKMVVARGGRTLDTIGFNLGHLLQEMDVSRGPLTIACRLRENTYLGRSTLQGRLIDVRAGGEADPTCG
ncbi:MAG: DHH family phosphoesterase [Gemmatimonadota bacterium]